MNREELQEIGNTLFGNRWITPLAKELGVRRETVSRWARGQLPIPALAINFLKLLKQKPKTIPYREKRHKAYGNKKVINGATFIHGDSRNISLDHQIDAILTDPVWPNAISTLSGAHNPYRLFSNSICNLIQFLKPDGRIIIQMRCDSDPRILSAIPNQYRYLRTCWLPYAIPSRQGRILISGDVAFIYGTPPKKRVGNIIMPGQPHSDFCPPVQPEKSKNQHPCPRNLMHVEWLVEKFTSPGDVILDPFMGSGTTAIAALNRGRQFIGIEIESKYFNFAQKRLEKATNQIEQ